MKVNIREDAEETTSSGPVSGAKEDHSLVITTFHAISVHEGKVQTVLSRVTIRIVPAKHRD